MNYSAAWVQRQNSQLGPKKPGRGMPSVQWTRTRANPLWFKLRSIEILKRRWRIGTIEMQIPLGPSAPGQTQASRRDFELPALGQFQKPGHTKKESISFCSHGSSRPAVFNYFVCPGKPTLQVRDVGPKAPNVRIESASDAAEMRLEVSFTLHFGHTH